MQKSFDLKKFAKALRTQPDTGKLVPDRDALTPQDLNPCLFEAYIHILRYESIDISRLDFDEIGEGDIENLENVLCYSPSTSLFEISDVFRRFAPSAAAGSAFI